VSDARAKAEVRERIERAAYEVATLDLSRWRTLIDALAEQDAMVLESMLSGGTIPDEGLVRARARAQAFREITKLLREGPEKVEATKRGTE
jgi:hypothetical protein